MSPDEALEHLGHLRPLYTIIQGLGVKNTIFNGLLSAVAIITTFGNLRLPATTNGAVNRNPDPGIVSGWRVCSIPPRAT